MAFGIAAICKRNEDQRRPEHNSEHHLSTEAFLDVEVYLHESGGQYAVIDTT